LREIDRENRLELERGAQQIEENRVNEEILAGV